MDKETYINSVAASLPLAVIKHNNERLRKIITDFYYSGVSESSAIHQLKMDFVDFLNERN